MKVRNLLFAAAVGVAGFLVGTVVVTELASPVVEFSLFVGLPAGVAVGLLLGGVAYAWLGDADSRRHRRGAVLAATGVAFLVSLVVLVVAGLRNSQALPLAGATGIAVGVGVSAWYRGQDAPPESP